MIFLNPSGAPELACNECGCRWFDRHTNTCYGCGEPVAPDEVEAFQKAVTDFHAARSIEVNAQEKGTRVEGSGE